MALCIQAQPRLARRVVLACAEAHVERKPSWLFLSLLQDKGADLTGVVERSELEGLARKMKGGAQASGGQSAS